MGALLRNTAAAVQQPLATQLRGARELASSSVSRAANRSAPVEHSSEELAKELQQLRHENKRLREELDVVRRKRGEERTHDMMREIGWYDYASQLYGHPRRTAPAHTPTESPVVFYEGLHILDLTKASTRMGATRDTPAPAVPNGTRVEVMHYHGGTFGKDDITAPNNRLHIDDWARWLYAVPGSGVFFDVGRSLAFTEHVEATLHFNSSLCPSRSKAVCRWVPAQVVHLARAQGWDSLQFRGHSADRVSSMRKFELLDLQPWRKLTPDSVLPRYFVGWPNGTRPCKLRADSRRLACRPPVQIPETKSVTSSPVDSEPVLVAPSTDSTEVVSV